MNRASLKIPSKTFLLGEYGVLFGGPIVVLTHAPFFEARGNSCSSNFHSESPASLLMSKYGLTKDFDFFDPHDGGGGFGGSTAEVVASLKGRVDIGVDELYNDYIKLFSSKDVRPSGADLYSQWSESSPNLKGFKISVFKNGKTSSLNWPFKDIGLLIYKRPKKLQTHNHLNEISKNSKDFNKLISIAENGIEFLKNSDPSFFDEVNSFAKEQSRLSLLDSDAFLEVERLKKSPEVVGARACGAMGVDVVTVFCSLKEDIDKLKAKIVDLNPEYKLVSTLL